MTRNDPARTHLAGLRRLRGLEVRQEHDGRIVLTDTFTSFKEVRQRTILICSLVTAFGFGAGLFGWKWALMPVWSVPISTALSAVGAVIASVLTYWKYTWNGRTWSIEGDTAHIVAKQRGQKRVQERVPTTEIATMSGACTAGVFKRPHHALCIGHPNRIREDPLCAAESMHSPESNTPSLSQSPMQMPVVLARWATVMLCDTAWPPASAMPMIEV